MNYSITKIETGFELRIWDRGRNASQKKRRFPTRKLAQDFMDRLSREEKDASSSVNLFGAEYDYWRQENDAEFAPGWRANLDSYWGEARPELENVRIDRLEPRLVELKSKWAGLSQKTINNKMGFIHAVLNFSVEKKRIKYNPLGSYRKPKAQPPDLEFWERLEAESFLNFLAGRYPVDHEDRIRFTAPFAAINTALRAGELWALRPRSLRKSHSSIRIVQQFNRVSKEFAQLKGKLARSVPLNPDLLTELERFSSGTKPNALVFSREGRPIDHDSFADLFDEDIRAWGGQRITFHGLRHTAATLMLSAGVDVKSLQEIMGHKDISTTMRYVHALGDSAAKAAEKFSVRPKSNVLRLADLG